MAEWGSVFEVLGLETNKPIALRPFRGSGLVGLGV